MAYTVPPPASRTRPTVVTIAALLLAVAAADQLISSGITASLTSKMVDAYRTAYQGSEVDVNVVVTGMRVAMYAQVAVGVLMAVGIGVLAMLDARGKQPARIITWVLGGLYLCCGTASFTGGALGSSLMSNNSGVKDGPSQTEVQHIVTDALPSWYTSVSLALSGIGLVAVLAAVILLALPVANEFFRKPVQQWEPPVPPTSYSGL